MSPSPRSIQPFISQWPQGTSIGRTRRASTVTPTTSAKPSCRSEPRGLRSIEAKLHAVIAAAEVIRPPVAATAFLIPSYSPLNRDSSWSRVIRKTL